MKSLEVLNQIYQQLPPYRQFNREDIQGILENYQAAWKLHYPEENNFTWEVIALEENEDTAGLYHDGQLGFIGWALPGEAQKVEDFIQLLLDRASKLGLEKLTFGSLRDPFGLGWSGLPKTLLPLIHCLQDRFEYTISESWILCALKNLQQINFTELFVDLPDLRFEYKAHTEIGEWDLIAWQNEQLIGECNAWAVPTYFNAFPEAAAWMTIEWIGIEDSFLARGIGSQLLCRQLAWQKSRGIDHLILWTETNNAPARRFFAKYGFQEIEEVFSLEQTFQV